MKLLRYFLKHSPTLRFLPSLWILLAIACNSPNPTSPGAPEGFVDIRQIEPDIQVDMMYFSSDNFLGRPALGYRANVCYLRNPAAEALKKAQQRLKAKAGGKNLFLRVRDCYRPAEAVQDFVAWTQDVSDTKMKGRFYPDLSKADLLRLGYIAANSGHTRGSSVDLTIAEIGENGSARELPMGTAVDFFGERSHTSFPGLKKEEKENRQLLLEVMQPEFKNYPKEWWHFALKEEPASDGNAGLDAIKKDGISTHIADSSILGELDLETHGPLSLLNLFRRLHAENRLTLPQVDSAAPSTGAALAAFAETYGRFAAIFSSDLSRILQELDVDWEKEIAKAYLPSAARTERGKELRTSGNVMRAFNEKWLTSHDGRFILAGIVNRIDRKDFEASGCGELRLIYRLGYEVPMGGKTYASRLPLTVNMVFSYLDDGKACSEVASLWRNVSSAKQILEGPLDFSRLKFKQMEINAQIARFPSFLEDKEQRHFAGQAIYWMRIFAVSKGQMETQKLENTPDVAGILKDEAKQKQLKLFVEQHLPHIDAGVFRLPPELETDLALTYSTLGSARTANRPFDLLLSEKQAQEILRRSPRRDFRFIASGDALLERLNTSSCMGCHQSSSTAGFHFLGKERFDFGKQPAAIARALDGNRLQLPFSPHFYSEIPRRESYLERLAQGLPPDLFRAHPSAPEAAWKALSVKFQRAKANMPCWIDPAGLAEFSKWSCEKGFTCEALIQNDRSTAPLGQCVPSAQDLFAGLACRKSEIEDHTAISMGDANRGKDLIAFNLSSFRDRVTSDTAFYDLPEGTLNASDLNCRITRIGVPLGRITRNCRPEERSLQNLKSEKSSREICGVVGGKGFDEMATGYFDSAKFAAKVARGLLNTCSATQPCREDYICQEMPDFLAGERFGVTSESLQSTRHEGLGFCTPTYFVYQLRLDGHPNPK